MLYRAGANKDICAAEREGQQEDQSGKIKNIQTFIHSSCLHLTKHTGTIITRVETGTPLIGQQRDEKQKWIWDMRYHQMADLPDNKTGSFRHWWLKKPIHFQQERKCKHTVPSLWRLYLDVIPLCASENATGNGNQSPPRWLRLHLKCLAADDTCRMSRAPKALGCFYRALTSVCRHNTVIERSVEPVLLFLFVPMDLWDFPRFSYFTLILWVVKSWAMTGGQDHNRYCASICWHGIYRITSSHFCMLDFPVTPELTLRKVDVYLN